MFNASPSAVTLVLILCMAWPLSSIENSWRQAAPGYNFRFPLDHASHPDYKIEWWYYTGNLTGEDGHRYGYQLTFFRIGVDFKPSNPSRWAVRDLFMAHLAVTDVAGRTYRNSERVNRAGPGWAGADTRTYNVWNDNWEVSLDPAGNHHLQASASDLAVNLALSPGKPPVLNGEHGFSRKGSEPGNASEYYSLTRMPTRGTIRAGNKIAAVQGFSWMDHEFGTSFLEPYQVGWDWLSIQLNDGRDLMLFQLRRKDGSRDAHSSGTIVDAAGNSSILAAADFNMEPGRIWLSPSSGGKYPVEWTVRIPGRQIVLSVRAALDNQELQTPQSTGVVYWEGAISAEGEASGSPVHGLGYLELTGYAGSPISERFR